MHYLYASVVLYTSSRTHVHTVTAQSDVASTTLMIYIIYRIYRTSPSRIKIAGRSDIQKLISTVLIIIWFVTYVIATESNTHRRAHTHTHKHTHTYTNKHTHTRARTRTHIYICLLSLYIARPFTETTWSKKPPIL